MIEYHTIFRKKFDLCYPDLKEFISLMGCNKLCTVSALMQNRKVNVREWYWGITMDRVSEVEERSCPVVQTGDSLRKLMDQKLFGS